MRVLSDMVLFSRSGLLYCRRWGVKVGRGMGIRARWTCFCAPPHPMAPSHTAGVAQSHLLRILGGVTEVTHIRCLAECLPYSWHLRNKYLFSCVTFLLQSEVQGRELTMESSRCSICLAVELS